MNPKVDAESTTTSVNSSFLQGLAPEGKAIRVCLQNAAECSQADTCGRRHFLATAHAAAAVGLAILAVPLYILRSAILFVAKLITLEPRAAVSELLNNLLNAGKCLTLTAIGVFYVTIGIFIPGKVYPAFNPPQVPVTISSEQAQLMKARQKAKDRLAKIKEHTARIKELEETQKKLQDQIQKLQDGAKVADDTQHYLQKELVDTQTQLKQANALHTTDTEQLKLHADHEKQLADRLQQVQDELSDVSSKKAVADQAIVKSQAQHEDALKQHQTDIAQIEKMQRDQKQLQDRLDQLQKTSLEIEEKRSVLEHGNSELEGKLKEAQTTTAETQTRLNTIIEEVSSEALDTVGDVTSLNKQLSEARLQHQQARNKHRHYSTRIHQRREEHRQIVEKLNQMQKLNKELLDERSAYLKGQSPLQAEFTQLQEKLKKATEALEKVSQVGDEHRGILIKGKRAVEKELEEAREQLKEAAATHSRDVAQIHRLQDEFREVFEELKAANEQLSHAPQLEQAVDQLSEACQKNIQSLDKRNAEVEALTNQNAALQLQLQQARLTIELQQAADLKARLERRAANAEKNLAETTRSHETEHKALVAQSHAVLAVVQDVSQSTTRKQVDALHQQLKAAGAAAPVVDVRRLEQRRVHLERMLKTNQDNKMDPEEYERLNREREAIQAELSPLPLEAYAARASAAADRAAVHMFCSLQARMPNLLT